MTRKLAAILACAACSATATTLATSAHAEPHVGIDWGKLLVDIDHYARTGSENPDRANAASSGRVALLQSERFGQPLTQNSGNAWFGVAPSVSFVARDWGQTYRLAGDRLSLVDGMRLSSSTRMVLTRVRLSNTRVTPFAQLGVGQWRTDTTILPFTPRSIEIAAQIGGGVEAQISRNWQIACEAGGTLLIRDEREADAIPTTKMWSTMLASRIVF
ncbi:hypothetical protein AKJ09_10191 [Labilithrix luteola]|uniref:Outer membrane protein beta-barrel domain-containing protein n=1 Tax=Labilithrix luteola TaxID=1391654 RepID=A0A0K1QCS3_9BACT|nr:hypothetical protein [Labilithrix luteola]AKV03528.1 hypothetical protein AKJ09_10191 [Labilithrix luteola]